MADRIDPPNVVRIHADDVETDFSPQIDAFAGALAALQAVMTPVPRDDTADAGSYSYTYASLDAVYLHLQQYLPERGFAHLALPLPSGPGEVKVRTYLIHESGQWARSTITMFLDNPNPQTIGGAISYARRYGLMAITGLPAEDDDGAGASGMGPADPTQLGEREEEVEHLLGVTRRLFPDQEGEQILEALAVARFRLSDGDWRKIPLRLKALAIKALEQKAASAKEADDADQN